MSPGVLILLACIASSSMSLVPGLFGCDGDGALKPLTADQQRLLDEYEAEKNESEASGTLFTKTRPNIIRSFKSGCRALGNAMTIVTIGICVFVMLKLFRVL